jgi:transcriptional regulator with XRE-family HTH domain
MPDRTITPLQKAAGQWLKERRLGAGLTQHELARRLGFKYYTHLSAIEATGKGRIAPRHYVDAARALKMDPKDFTWEQLRFYEPEIYQILQPERSRK